ncbi:hypothetical protein EV363DRAFT_1301443 [Boletus edulis]|nr:hypothetical protein EV363DRAFT_1301443 [Boletus edulis]
MPRVSHLAQQPTSVHDIDSLAPSSPPPSPYAAAATSDLAIQPDDNHNVPPPLLPALDLTQIQDSFISTRQQQYVPASPLLAQQPTSTTPVLLLLLPWYPGTQCEIAEDEVTR